MNNYSSTTYLADNDEWEAIIPNSYIEDEKKSLSELYGGEPDEWFWDDIEQEWMYMDSTTGQILSEEQVATMQYYDELDESEVASELL